MTKKELIICLYGSTGDLSFRKLIPALSKLKLNNKLPDKTLILALGRREYTTETYFEFIETNNPSAETKHLKDITKYYKMEILNNEDYLEYKNMLMNYSDENTRVIHYLAISSNMMIEVSNNISKNGIVQKNNLKQSLVFEKPFGRNYSTSHQINETLLKNYNENQIYRLDHYLGKDLVKAILDLRFKTNLLESALSPKKLTSIDIAAKEDDGILNRGEFYDQTGAVRDMFQSHLLQIVSLLTMNKPKEFNSLLIVNEKVKALKNVTIKKDSLIFGQYSGYLEEENISPNSLTETMVKVTLNVKNKFKNIPINILTGKKLNKKETYIKFNLKDGSQINLNIFPNKSITFVTKLLNEVIDVGHTFTNIDDEYATLISAVINYKQENFVRSDEIELAWRISDNLLTYKNELTIYNNKIF